MKRKNIFATILLCVMMCLLTACGSGTNVKVNYDLTLQDNVAYSVGAVLNEGKYYTKYRGKVFKLKGKIKSSGDDYHEIVTNDGCCQFTMEVRLDNDDYSWDYIKMNKTYTIVATYTLYKSSATSKFYFAINKFC